MYIYSGGFAGVGLGFFGAFEGLRIWDLGCIWDMVIGLDRCGMIAIGWMIFVI
ncbi:hypothetical protein DFH27DRAFT_569369, partial [Peziza echinospora]